MCLPVGRGAYQHTSATRPGHARCAPKGRHRTVLDNLSWSHMLILAVAGLFILGPERLPDAAAWLGRTIRQVRDFTAGAREQLQREIGPEFDELREPLRELSRLRELDPRRAAITALFDDDPAPRSGLPDAAPNGVTPEPMRPGGTPRPLAPGERPPIDTDAT